MFYVYVCMCVGVHAYMHVTEKYQFFTIAYKILAITQFIFLLLISNSYI